jgi:glyoxylase-like metal-dependent hydrolase (beta-lactamase superfamily II)/rhodanese-related sulfurtransferase
MLKRITTLGFVITLLTSIGITPAQAEEQTFDADQFLAEARKKVNNINTEELKALLEEAPDTVLLDVRTPDEINVIGGIIDANRTIVMPRGWVEFRVLESDYIPNKDTPIVVYCGTNVRSPVVADRLTQIGYTNVKNYADGYFAWEKAGLPLNKTDKAPQSMLYDLPRQVTDGVWSAIGATAPPTYQNSGHNNNLSFIVTDEGVVVVNAGDNYLLAKALHDEIKKITDQPVKYVVLENGQGHAMLGTNYWQEQGATVIAHTDALHEIEEYGEDEFDRMQQGRRDKAMSTVLAKPDETFTDKRTLTLGGETIELLNIGPAHSPGDIVVWLPEKKVMISGDMAFHQRMLPVFEHTDTDAWIETWDKFEAFEPEFLIPGHGEPTNMAEVRKYTKDYLVYLREKIGAIIEDGGTLDDAYKIDQSAYASLDTYSILARQNAGRIFREMEFE